MLKSVMLKKVTMEGFKCYKDKREEIINASTIFVGTNGAGKSTIADSISWAFTGKLFEGEKNVENGFLNEHSNKAIVEVFFEDENGNERTIKRSYTVASGISVWLDGKATTQKKLANVIDPDTFLLVFNPLIFLDKKPGEARKIILSLIDLSSVTDDNVISNLSNDEKSYLENVDLSDLEKETKEIRKSISEKDKETVILNGYITKNTNDINALIIPQKKALIDDKIIKEAEIKVQNTINDKPKMTNYLELLNEKGEIEKQIAEVKANKFDYSQIKNLEKDKDLVENEIKYTEKMTYSPSNLVNLEMEVNEYNKDISRFEKINKELKDKILNVRNQYNFKKGDCCPVCGEALTENGISGIAKFVKEQTQEYMSEGVSNKSSIEDIEKKVNSLLDRINNLKKADEAKKQEFEANKIKKLENINKKLKSIEEQLSKLKNQEIEFEKDKDNQIKSLLEKIKNLNVDSIKKSFDDYEDTIKVEKATLTQLQSENKEIQTFNKEIDRLLEKKETLNKENINSQSKIDEINEEITSLKAKINSITHFKQVKISLIEDDIKKHFNKVSFKIEDVNEDTGEVTSCFKILYDGKIIETASLSEQVKGGVEIAEMVQNSLGLEYPLFMDNNESIIEVKSSIKQIIRTIVVDVPNVVSINESTLSKIHENAKDIVLKAS